MYDLIALLSVLLVAPQIGYGAYKLMLGWDIRRDDEQDHRQKLERQQERHRQKLEATEKLREVLSLLIVDANSAEVIQEHLNENFPKVRFEPEEELEEEPEPEPARKRRGAKK